MAALTQDTDYFVKQNGPNVAFVQIMVQTKNTVDAADTLTVDLSKYGGNQLIGVLGFKHTTDNSVMVQEQPTTAVSGTTVTLTVPAGTDNDPRFYIIWATSGINP